VSAPELTVSDPIPALPTLEVLWQPDASAYVLTRSREGELSAGQLHMGMPSVADLAHLAFDEMEIVEQPLGGGRDRLAPPHIAREHVVRVAEHARVFGQPAQEPRGTALRVARERETGRKGASAFFEAFDAEEFAVQRA